MPFLQTLYPTRHVVLHKDVMLFGPCRARDDLDHPNMVALRIISVGVQETL